MQKVLRLKTTVQPGGKVEFVIPELEAGQVVGVVLHESGGRDAPSWRYLTTGRSAACSRRRKRGRGPSRLHWLRVGRRQHRRFQLEAAKTTTPESPERSYFRALVSLHLTGSRRSPALT